MIVFSSHLLHNAIELADRVGLLVAGQMGRPTEVPAFHAAATRKTPVRVVLNHLTDAMTSVALAASMTRGGAAGQLGRRRHLRCRLQRGCAGDVRFRDVTSHGRAVRSGQPRESTPTGALEQSPESAPR